METRGSNQDQQDILAGKRVVVVEDEGITLLHLQRILHSVGMRLVGIERSAPGGVALILRERPDLVLMDINMPGEYNGIEATRRIHAVIPTCVILFTAYTDYTDQAEAAGACGYVVKPLDKETLLFQIRKALTGFVAGETARFGEG